MARLTGMNIEAIQADATGVAVKAARVSHEIIVLKGAYTVIADADRRTMSLRLPIPVWLRRDGDVLAGVVAGLVAQNIPLFEAAVAGVYLHGKAGEIVCNRLGDTGMVAGDLLPVLPEVIKIIKEIQPRK